MLRLVVPLGPIGIADTVTTWIGEVAPTVGACAPHAASATVSLKLVVLLSATVVTSFSVAPPASVRYSFRPVVPAGPVWIAVTLTTCPGTVPPTVGAATPNAASAMVSLKFVVLLSPNVARSFSAAPPAVVRYNFRPVVPAGPVWIVVTATICAGAVAAFVGGGPPPSAASVLLSRNVVVVLSPM